MSYLHTAAATLLAAALSCAPCLSAQTSHTGGVASLATQNGDRVQAGDASAGFDRSRALAISQAAIGRTLDSYRFVDATGRQRTLAEFRGKPLVISLIYTRCHHICPTTTRHLAKVVANAQQVLGRDSFAVVSLGFDTVNDTVEAMGEFARNQNVDLPNWEFLATDGATMQSMADAMGFQFMAAGGGFNHLLQTTVVDAEGRIQRQVYGMDFDPPMLIEPLKALVFGVEADISFFSEISNRIRLFCTVYDPASDSYRFDYSIFVGLAMGLVLGTLFVVILVREWRSSNAARRRDS